MRTIMDGEERVEVTEHRIGYGARAGNARPLPTEAALCFKRDGGALVTRSALPGSLHRLTAAELLAVLHSKP